ncbi:hypothetical protein AVEN_117805-1 [Araneus ventricosus]|uniref:Uncharacterized protein n=1 Tax=Araneus ventricosus TaxID=182803 RepID=A0A4Y2B832_ARAVE|nr:hypothetical protein AVEN_117805-1 [Araneus ventricosus]
MKEYYNQGATTVIFDGYPEGLPEKSINSAERLRRANRQTAPEVVFSYLMTVTMPRAQFLFNDCNKGRLIAIFSVKLEGDGFLVKKPTKDADHMIVTNAIVAAEEHTYAVLV